MSKHKLREDNTCLNCGSFVEGSYCSGCGQQNTESRQSFHHLFTHFVFDYLHYDSSFWISIKCLLFRPGRLSREYMRGRRKSYVNPFSLYIFISFLTFFIPPLLPKVSDAEAEQDFLVFQVDDEDTSEKSKGATLDSLYRTSRYQYLSTDNIFYKMTIKAVDNIEDKNRQEKAFDFFVHNIPKALFVFMPLFAFLLWLFHSKKRFYYFDSGIFTLHFFSVVLLSYTIGAILICIAEWLEWDWLEPLTWIFFIGYITFYFFRGSRKFYMEKRWVSNVKSFFLVIINFFLILFVLVLYAIFTFYKVYS